jgi:peroxiredoxin Q/BCP
MEAYRDQYASVFRGGRGVTVIGISDDSVEELGSWAADADFPVLFAQDEGHTVAESYGLGLRTSGNIASRSVIVVGPDGKIAWVTERFREIDPTAYDELGAEVDRVAPMMDDGGDQSQDLEAGAGPDC